MPCQAWLYLLNYLVCIISFLKVKALFSALCTPTLTNTSSGDIVEWCLESWQVKDKVEKDLHNKYVDEKRSLRGHGKKELHLEVVARSFFTFPLSIHLKFYLAKKRGQKVSFWWAELQDCVPIHLVLIHASWERSLASLCFTTVVFWAGQLGA